MNEDYWAPVFARLHEDLSLLELIAHDTHDSDLISWIKTNPRLWSRCARYMQRKKIGNREGLINELINQARNDQALRKLIFFNWVEKNPQPMNLFTLSNDQATFQRLLNGDFGNPAKVAILARIDPRPGTEAFYQEFFAGQQPEGLPEETSAETGIQPNDGLVDDLRRQMEELRRQVKESQQAFNQRANEITGLQTAIAQRDQLIEAMRQKQNDLENELRQNRISDVTINPQDSARERELHEQTENLQQKVAHLSSLLDECKSRKEFLEARLNRCEAAINSLSAQNRQLKDAINIDEDKDRKIATLKNLAQELDRAAAETRFSGQLLCVDDGKKSWYLSCFGGDLIGVPSQLVRESDCCQAEFCSASVSEDGTITAVNSLETEKEFKVGYLVEKDGMFFLNSGEDELALRCEIPSGDRSRPCRGIYLYSFLERPAGIYELFFVDQLPKTIAETKFTTKRPASEAETVGPKLNFGGKKLLILGGDYVGHEYQKQLSSSNLQVTWKSGFENLGQLGMGLKNFDLVVIILRQISHTLLRETVAAAEKQNVKLFYSKKRGTSGLLSEMKTFFGL